MHTESVLLILKEEQVPGLGYKIGQKFQCSLSLTSEPSGKSDVSHLYTDEGYSTAQNTGHTLMLSD